jgi:cysteine desulfurase/selenocysteine lyase
MISSTTASPDWAAIRADFPILDQEVHGRPLIYFDSAASSQKPRLVIEALRHYYEHDHANVHRGLHALSTRATEAYEGARAKVAKYLGATSAEEIVFTRGTTEGINLVAQAWGTRFVRAGDVILLTEMEHHSNLVPWQMLAERTGAQLRFVPVREDGTLELESLPRLLTPEVKLFAFTHISNSLGTINPVAELCAAARAVGAVTLVDAAQSAGHLPVDVQAMGCDFLAFSGHKMCAPTGIGALYGRAEILEATPPYQGGGEMILSVTYERATYKSAPHRFEAGTPNIAGAVGLGAAIDYLEAIGREAIWAHDQSLVDHAYQRMAEIPGIRLLGPTSGSKNRGGLVSFAMDGTHAHDIVTIADEAGIALRGGHHCTQPLMAKLGLESSARASFYFYNTHDEIDRFIQVLSERASSPGKFALPLGEIYEMVVNDHSSRPRNFGPIREGAIHTHGDNPSCGDSIDLYLRLGENKVDEIKFTGAGCTICMTSASLMTIKLKGKSVAEAKRLAGLFKAEVTGTSDESVNRGPRELGDLNVLRGVRKFPQRVKCAMLAWRAFEQALESNAGEASVSTE